MSDAFKCERCGDYNDGSPCRRKYRSYAGVSAFSGWTDGTTKTKAELCEDCASTVDQRVAYLLSGETNE